MNEVLAILQRLATDEPLSGEQVSVRLEERGWTVVHRTPSAPFPRVWRHGDLEAGIQGDGPVDLEITLWEHDIEEVYGDDGLDPIYDEAVDRIRRFAGEVEASPLAARLTAAEGDPTQGLDYIDHRAWRLAKRMFLLGAIQQDTDLPVYVVASIS